MPTNPRLTLATYEGFPDGMNVSDPPNQIKETQARYIQDAWIHRVSFTERRGPVQAVSSVATFSDKAFGIFYVLDPTGVKRICVLHGTGSTITASILSSDFASTTDITLSGTYSSAPYLLVDSKPMLNGGLLIGISTDAVVGPATQSLVMWEGGNKAQYDPASVTVTQASKTVTAASGFTANVSPGMFLFTSGGARLVGVVATVDSDTSLTLKEPALEAIAAAGARFQSFRGFQTKIGAGVITVTSGGTAITGSNTKFKDQGVKNNDKIYRRSDFLLLGTVNGDATANLTLTMTASAAAMTAEDYFIVPSAVDYGQSTLDATKAKPGFLNCVYQEQQFYASRGIKADLSGEFVNRLYYSDPFDPEIVDFSVNDGSYIPVISDEDPQSPIRALAPGYNSLVILKDSDAWALFGSDPDQFNIKRIGSDGTLSTMSVATYGDSVIWAGREGIYTWDGVEATNIVAETLGDFYANAVKGFDPGTYRMWGFVHRDHYFLHIENCAPPVAVIKANVSVTPNRMTIVIHLPRLAVTVFTNSNFRGFALIPHTTGFLAWAVVNNASGQGRIIDMNTLFDVSGNDAFACDTSTAGPDFYIESRKYDINKPLLKKLWKMLILHYLAGGDSLRLDTVVGLNDVGAQSTSTWPITEYTWSSLAVAYPTWFNVSQTYPTWASVVINIFFTRRIKFLKRNQFIAFRIYQNSSSVNAAKIGPFSFGYKEQRPGRV